MTESKDNIANALYAVAEFVIDNTEYEDFIDLTDILHEKNVFEKVYPNTEEIEKMQKEYSDFDSFWAIMQEGDFHYRLGTKGEMIKRLEGKT